MTIVINMEVMVPFVIGAIFGGFVVWFAGFMNKLEKSFMEEVRD